MRTGAFSKGDVVAALEIGSSKVCCVIARIGEDDAIRPLGIGYQAAHGVRGGAVVDMDAAELAVLNAVHAAERAANQTIHEVILAIACGQPESRIVPMEVPLGAHEVGDADLRRVLNAGLSASDPETGALGLERELIHTIPISYSLDGVQGIRDPRGMFGEQLGVNMHVFTVSGGAVRNFHSLLARCNLEIAMLVAAPIAAGYGCLVEDERHLGVAVIDIGAGTTDLAIFIHDRAVFADSIPIGGNAITNDIARGVGVSVAQAERLKVLHGGALATSGDDGEIIAIQPLGDESEPEDELPRAALARIIQPRMEEILELVRQQIDASGLAAVPGRRLVLTGGGSQLQGVRQLASMVLDKQARDGRPISVDEGTLEAGGQLVGLRETASGPAFATVAGLLRYAQSLEMALPGQDGFGARLNRGVLGRLGAWIRDNL